MKTPDFISKEENIYLLRMLSSVLLGKSVPEPNEKINWALVFSAASKHSVAGMTYHAVKSLPDSCKPPKAVYDEFVSAYRSELILEGNIQFETDKMISVLTKANVDVLPIKGITIKHYYPTPSMRSMSDVDILYKTEDKKKVIDIFQKSGYILNRDALGQLDFVKEPFYHYELHSSLLSENKKNYEYFSTIWDKAIYSENSKTYELTPEDSYIYLLEHLAKHIEGGGAGLRMVMDVFVFKNVHSKRFDNEYLNAELSKLHLCKFRERIEQLADSWFLSDTPDVSSSCADFILKCPTFGLVSNAIVFESLMYERQKGKKQSGISRLIRRVFPSYFIIYRRFPIAKKCKFLYPFLVPVYWILRIFKDKNVNYSSVKLYVNPDNANKTPEIEHMIEELGFDERL